MNKPEWKEKTWNLNDTLPGTEKGSITDPIISEPGIDAIKVENVELSVFPARGWLVSSIKFSWIEILYQDMYRETLWDTSKSVKWGIPYMFPNAGPLTDHQIKQSHLNLPQHGTGRISPWKQEKILEDRVKISFSFLPDKVYPYKWIVYQEFILEDNSVLLNQNIINQWDDMMPVSTGLHPYFRVPQWDKSKIQWNIPQWEEVSKQRECWENGGTITFDNPKQEFSIYIPWLWKLYIEVSDEYEKFWVWSLPWKDFICIEPVMWQEWKIVEDPVYIKAWEKNSNFMKIRLEV